MDPKVSLNQTLLGSSRESICLLLRWGTCPLTWKSEGFISASAADSPCDPGQVPLLLGASVSPSQKSNFETCPSGKDYCNPFGDIGSRLLLALRGCLEPREVGRKPPGHTLTSRARGAVCFAM